MKILILGATGFMGRPLSAGLSANHSVHTFDGRISEIDRLENFVSERKIDLIVHMVSTLIPSSNNEDFYKSIDEVIVPSYKLIDLASKLKIKFVFISSGGTIYGQSKDADKFLEEHLAQPKNQYGFSKHLIEQYIFYKNRSEGLKYLILRPSNVYGEGQSFNRSQGFIGVAIDRILNGQNISIWGDGSNFRNYLYLGDFVSSVCQLIDRNVYDEILNLAGPEGASLLDIIKLISEETGLVPDITFEVSKQFDVSHIDLCSERLNALVTVEYTSLREGVKNQIEYYKQHFYGQK